HLKEVDLRRMKAEKGKGNIEAMAREERYRFFASLAKELRIGTVATAHTRDDQVETLLMWLLRGTGTKGLGGLPPVRRLAAQALASEKVLLVRPLIETSRAEIMEYLTERDLSYRTDRTNFDPLPMRNWIRHLLLPQLRERTGARLNERLAGLADILREEERWLRRMATERLSHVLHGDRLSRPALLQEDKALQRRLVRLWLEKARGDLRAIDFDHVEKLLRFIAYGPPQGRISLPGGWELVREYEEVGLERKRARPKAACYSYELPLEGEVTVPEAGVKISISRESRSADALPQGGLEEIFDLACLSDGLTVRNFRAGDRFQPLGMQGHKKVKDLFIEKKAPLSVRAVLPLLLAGSEIVWIPGYGRSEMGRVTDRSKEVVKVRLKVLDR
ncbi:MAG: tRNA lysidine(34) synthetase TilS, partial [Candidatus Binatia bacterium]